MKLGIALTLGARQQPGDPIARWATAAEDAGLDSVWFFDSIGRSWPSIDPLMAVTRAASVTRHIQVGTGILEVPLRHPVELANRVMTAHLFCGDRLLLGVGAGSTKADFEAVDKSFDDRMSLFEEGLAIMRRLWNGETVGTANLQPVDEVRGGPPLVIGSWAGPTWIPRAAREFDGWIASAHFAGAEKLETGIKAYREAGGKLAIVTNIWLDLDADGSHESGGFHLQCDPQTARERLSWLMSLGFDEAVVAYHGEGEPDFAAIRALLPTT